MSLKVKSNQANANAFYNKSGQKTKLISSKKNSLKKLSRITKNGKYFKEFYRSNRPEVFLLALGVTMCDQNILHSMTGIGLYVLFKLYFQHFMEPPFSDSNPLPIAILNPTL